MTQAEAEALAARLVARGWWIFHIHPDEPGPPPTYMIKARYPERIPVAFRALADARDDRLARLESGEE